MNVFNNYEMQKLNFENVETDYYRSRLNEIHFWIANYRIIAEKGKVRQNGRRIATKYILKKLKISGSGMIQQTQL